MRIHLLAFIFLLPFQLLAENIQIAEVSEAGVDRFYYAGQRDPRLESDFLSVINQIASLIQNPPKVYLYISEAASNAGFNGGRSIVFPQNFFSHGGRFDQGQVMKPIDTATVIGHEYGHAIFEAWIYSSLSSHHQEVLQKLKFLSDKRELALTSGSDLDSFKKDLAEIMLSADYKTYEDLFLPYTELFADVVITYTLNYKAAMFQALYVDEESTPQHRLSESIQFKLAKLRHFDLEFKLSDEVAMSDAHTKLAYTRTYIGKSLWPKDSKQVEPYLKILMSAIIEVTDKYKKENHRPDIKEANRDLIQALEKRRMNLRK